MAIMAKKAPADHQRCIQESSHPQRGDRYLGADGCLWNHPSPGRCPGVGVRPGAGRHEPGGQAGERQENDPMMPLIWIRNYTASRAKARACSAPPSALQSIWRVKVCAVCWSTPAIGAGLMTESRLEATSIMSASSSRLISRRQIQEGRQTGGPSALSAEGSSLFAPTTPKKCWTALRSLYLARRGRIAAVGSWTLDRQ